MEYDAANEKNEAAPSDMKKSLCIYMSYIHISLWFTFFPVFSHLNNVF